MNHEQYMHLALELAAKGAGFVSPNPMVGALVVSQNRIVGRGYHQVVGGPHAEVNALDDAGDRARGATLYVTLEPCNHHGRTPPCTQKILDAGIARVVVAMADPNPHVTGGGNAFLRSCDIEVLCGVCESEAKRLNESFIKHSRTRNPFVLLKMAATLDGRIATRTGDARWVTGPQARSLVHQMRHAMDAIMVGIGTVTADDPELTTRLETPNGVDPVRVILDTRLQISPSSRVLNLSSTADTIIACGSHAKDHKKERLTAQGAVVWEIPLKDNTIDLQHLMMRLGAHGITSLLVEGGSRVAGAALKAGIVDKIQFFYAPKILGGADGVPLCAGQGPDLMDDCISLRDVGVRRVGEDILVSGYLNPKNRL